MLYILDELTGLQWNTRHFSVTFSLFSILHRSWDNIAYHLHRSWDDTAYYLHLSGFDLVIPNYCTYIILRLFINFINYALRTTQNSIH